MEPIVIVGSGIGGYTVAKELRKRGASAPIHLVTRDDGISYSKPMLSNALAAGKTPMSLRGATPEQMAEQLAIRVSTYTDVSAVAPDTREIAIGDDVLRYAVLVLAVGADPIRVRIEGDDSGIISVNDLSDYARLRAALAHAQHVAILGAGLIGCEFANDMTSAGFAITVIDPAVWPLSRLAPEPIGRALESALDARGVTWRPGAVAEHVEESGNKFRLHLSDRHTVEADLVVSAIGLRPRTALASRAGLHVNRGIVTDELLAATNGVYAVGDCAEIAGVHMPYVLPIVHGARALAKTLTGEPTRASYPPMPVVVKTPALPLTLLPPPAGARGSWRIDGAGRDLAARFVDAEDRLMGFALAGAANAQRQTLMSDLRRAADAALLV